MIFKKTTYRDYFFLFLGKYNKNLSRLNSFRFFYQFNNSVMIYSFYCIHKKHHGKSEAVEKMVAALAVSRKGVPFDSLDVEPSYIFFLLVAPIDSAGPHLKILAQISRLLKDKFFRDSLKSTKSGKEMLDLVSQEDARLG